MKLKKKNIEIIVKNGKPSRVILDIVEYKKLLERAENLEDIRMLGEMRKGQLKFKKLEDFLKEYNTGV